MASYRLRIKKDVEKELRGLPRAHLSKIIKKISALTHNPRPMGCEKLKGEEGYRIRQGPYRIVYLIDDLEHLIRIMKVGHRREVYR